MKPETAEQAGKLFEQIQMLESDLDKISEQAIMLCNPLTDNIVRIDSYDDDSLRDLVKGAIQTRLDVANLELKNLSDD